MEIELYINRYSETIRNIKKSAHDLHENVNQKYAKIMPYSFHLNMVASIVETYLDSVCQTENDILPIIFGAYYHDSIEDARLTYNDVFEIACKFMSERQACLASEIVYALTNEKGKTRAERANQKYYSGIRQTPYAPFIKLADRLANTKYSAIADNDKMKYVYAAEYISFLDSITVKNSSDIRFLLPHKMIEELELASVIH